MSVPTLSPATTPSFTPVGYLVEGVCRYVDAGPDPVAYHRVYLEPAVGNAISEAYLAAPDRDRRAFAAYAVFNEQTLRQYDFLIGRVEFGGLGVTVRVVDDDPYPDVAALVEDLRQRRLLVWSSAATGNPHPYLSDAQNDMFRAVHDAYGHAASGRGFDPHGEEAAWLKHSSMYSPVARRALATEIRGQTCVTVFRYGGARFPEQKAALLPRWISDPRSVSVATRFRAPSATCGESLWRS